MYLFIYDLIDSETMTKDVEIIEITPENLYDHKLCGQINLKHEGHKRKTEWLKKRFTEGLVYKVLHSENEGDLGMIEYIPGERSWRAISAPGYMVIHCIVIMKKPSQKHGYGKLLLDEAIKDAKAVKKKGVCAVTSTSTFMASKDLFLKNGFEVIGEAPPCFELVSLKFKKNAPDPKFKGNWEKKLKDLGKGLTIIRSDQCAYTVKNIGEIVETAKESGVKPKVIDLKDHRAAQKSPSPYGTFAMVYNGKLVADHPISKGRFKNILKELGK